MWIQKKKVFDVYWATISFTGGTCPLFTSGKCYASTSKCQKAPKLYDLIKKLKKWNEIESVFSHFECFRNMYLCHNVVGQSFYHGNE